MRIQAIHRATLLVAMVLAPHESRAQTLSPVGPTKANIASVFALPFKAASPGLLTGLQTLLRTESGAGLIARYPALENLRQFSPESPSDLNLLGALQKDLPRGFETILALTVASSLEKKETDTVAELIKGAWD